MSAEQNLEKLHGLVVALDAGRLSRSCGRAVSVRNTHNSLIFQNKY